MLKTAMRVTALLIGSLLALFLLFLLTFWLSSTGAKRANGICEMQIIEKKISLEDATEYRRACMASKGYGMLSNCYVKDYTGSSCFRPQWMFWVRTI